jgi:hypothetical protein
MQEPTARKRGRRPEAREGQGQKPGIFLKVLPSEEYCRLKPMPEKTRPLGFEQKQGIAIWYCQSVNPAFCLALVPFFTDGMRRHMPKLFSVDTY